MLKNIHGKNETIQSYLWVTSKNKCWETRGLLKNDQILVASHHYKNGDRDGLSEEYHSSGRQCSKKLYKEGELQESEEWDEQGNKL